MKRDKIIYWTTTILFAGFMLFSAIPNIMLDQASVDFIHVRWVTPSILFGLLALVKLPGVLPC